MDDKIGATTYNYQLVVKISDLRFSGYKMDTGSDDVYVAELEGTVFYDQTDGKAISIELQNEIADYAV